MYGGPSERLITARILRGWELEEAIRPIETEVYEFDGEKKTLFEWCELMHLHHEDTYFRIIRGHNLEDILKEPLYEEIGGKNRNFIKRLISLKELV